MEIRVFQKSDIDTVFALQQAAYKPLYEKYRDDATSPYLESKDTVFQKYTREGTTSYLFLREGVPVGAVRITVFPESKRGKVSALCVHPQYQEQGIAQQALLAIERLHPEVERWFLDTILQEKGNCHLYEKLGYTRTGSTEEINDRMTLVSYEKER